MPRIRTLLVLVIASVGITGCGTWGLGEAADALKSQHLPIVANVDYSPANYLDPDELDIDLVSTATGDDAAQLWCQVLVPIGAATDNTFIWFHGSGDEGYQGPSEC